MQTTCGTVAERPSRAGEVDLAEAALAEQPLDLVAEPCFRAVDRLRPMASRPCLRPREISPGHAVRVVAAVSVLVIACGAGLPAFARAATLRATARPAEAPRCGGGSPASIEAPLKGRYTTKRQETRIADCVRSSKTISPRLFTNARPARAEGGRRGAQPRDDRAAGGGRSAAAHGRSARRRDRAGSGCATPAPAASTTPRCRACRRICRSRCG